MFDFVLLLLVKQTSTFLFIYFNSFMFMIGLPAFYVCGPCACLGARGGQRRALDLPERELKMVVSC